MGSLRYCMHCVCLIIAQPAYHIYALPTGSWKGITVAVKVCNLMPNQVDDGTVTKGSPFIHMEAAMAAKLRHPNVVRLHDCKIDRPNAGKSPNLSPKGTTDSNMRWKARIIMEYCENGSLRSALQQGLLEGQEGRPVQPELGAALALSYDMACGMVYLHTLQVELHVYSFRGSSRPYHHAAVTAGYSICRQPSHQSVLSWCSAFSTLLSDRAWRPQG